MVGTHAQKLPAKIQLKLRYRKIVYFKSISRTSYLFEGRQTIYCWICLRLNFGLVVVGKHFEHFCSWGHLFKVMTTRTDETTQPCFDRLLYCSINHTSWINTIIILDDSLPTIKLKISFLAMPKSTFAFCLCSLGKMYSRKDWKTQSSFP